MSYDSDGGREERTAWNEAYAAAAGAAGVSLRSALATRRRTSLPRGLPGGAGRLTPLGGFGGAAGDELGISAALG